MIVGLCRFSFLSDDRGGWKSAPSDVATARRTLFAKKRMEARFELFQRYTLPSIRNQTDDDFRFLILTSTDMPKAYHDRLMDITADDSRIKILSFPIQNSKSLMRRMFSKEFDQASRRISFRVDDDDGLSVNFIRRLRRTAEKRKSSRPFFLTFGKGIVIADRGDRIGWATECAYPFSSVGLAFSASPGMKRCIYDFQHHDCHRHFDTVVLSGAPAFIQCVHGFNDTVTLKRVQGTKHFDRTTVADVARSFQREFPYLTADSRQPGGSDPLTPSTFSPRETALRWLDAIRGRG